MTVTHAARLASLSTLLLLGGCSVDGVAILPALGSGLGDDGANEGDDADAGEGEDAGNEAGQDSQGDDGASLDLPDDGEQPFAQACQVIGLDAAPPCGAMPPSDTIEPVVAWTWTGPNGEQSVLTTPLVANLDDDNADHVVDLCDHPDILVLAVDTPPSKELPLPDGHLYMLDSATGETKQAFAYPVDATATPALGDLDHDGVPDILVLERGDNDQRRVVALRVNGSIMWKSEVWVSSNGGGALSIADLDADGTPEILAPDHVLAADGSFLWMPENPPIANSLPFAADLDLDGQLEVLFGRSVYDHEGALKFQLALFGPPNSGVSAVANFDDDPELEIYVHSLGHRVFEHDGTLKADCLGTGNSGPASIVDTNADGRAEILANFGTSFRASEIVEVGDGGFECTKLWEVKVTDGVGTAFDFLGDGGAEAIYADVDGVRIYDASGQQIGPAIERDARASMANPVVADADNDGAAELIIVSAEPEGLQPEVGFASVVFVQNHDDRFAPTRRIWNQHAYHAINVREDGHVPIEQVNWTEETNSFRINPAPTYAGDECQNPSFP